VPLVGLFFVVMSAKPKDKTLAYRTPQMAIDGTAVSPLAGAVTGGAMITQSMAISLVSAAAGFWPDFMVVMIVCPFSLMVAAAGSALYCGAPAARFAGITTRWPAWISAGAVVVCVAALVVHLFLAAARPLRVPLVWELSSSAALFLTVTGLAACFWAAVYRAGEFGKALKDRGLETLSTVGTVVILTVYGIAVSLFYIHGAVRPEVTLFATLGCVIVVAVALVLIFRRSRRLFERVLSVDVTEDIHGE
jgi:hypothetical protein